MSTRQLLAAIVASFCLLGVGLPAALDEISPIARSTQYGGQREDFLVGTQHNRGFVVLPHQRPAAGSRPWIWYAPTFVQPSGGLPDPSHAWMFEQLLTNGFAIAGVDVGESYGNPAGRAAFTEFYRAVLKRYGLSPKACLLPQSRGGLMLYNWAAGHAACVQCIGGIYPVCDLSSWPGLAKSSPAYGLNEAELGEHLREHNPIDRLAPLAQARIPILHLQGDADTVVPLERNSGELARRYRALGGSMELVIVAGKGHQVCPEFFESRRLVDFFLLRGKPSSAGPAMGNAAATTGESDLAGNTAESTANLEQGFLHPPKSARPWVYYFIMDGNLTREGITADFEALKRAGIGGVLFMEVDVGLPRGPVKFMSQEWRQIFKHAVAEAERLGLQMTLNAGPGWTGSGGPWVKPEQSMQHIVASAVEVTGPTNFNATLARPSPRAPYFGNAGLPADLLKAKEDFYVDVAVLAVPKTTDSQRISDIDEKALYLRHPYSSRPGTKPFLPAPANYPAWPAGAVVAADRIVDLTAKLGADGRLAWDVPAGQWTILRFGRTSTGANTRPAPASGLGLECDKFDQAALDAHFDAFIGALLREIGPRQESGDAGWNMLHIDSWEMGAQNWTAAFREEFRRRRSYDLMRYLPVVTGRVVDSLEVSERFLWDLRQTAQELTIENHAQHLKDLGRRHGFGLSIEPYDMNPCADLSLGAVADVPMGEFWLYGFNTFFSVIEAASIAHTGGRPVVAAESFTSGDAERWQAYPASMKALGDWAFSAGVNRIVFHRCQHQPQLDRRPGMTMGPYGVHWERTQTWWDMVPAYHAYLARCQFVLRQGLSVADICYLAAEGAPQVFRPPSSATRGIPPERLGYNFDGCAPETLRARMTVKDGRLVLPDGMRYRVLVLPERDTMTPTLLRKVKELVEAGATVIGPRPLKSPSLSGYPQCDEEVRQMAAELWGDCDGKTSKEHAHGKGRVVWDLGAQGAFAQEGKSGSEPEQYGDFAVVAGVLEKMGVAHDFESDGPLRYTHRRVGGTEIYFVASREDRSVDANCTFRVSGKAPELWDPLTGEVRTLPEFTANGDCTTVPIRFEPTQSFFVIFRKPATGVKAAGRNFAEVDKVAELSGPWEVAFDPAWGGPGKVTFQTLDDWSKRPEDGIKFYSGTAIYRKRFDLPESLSAHRSSPIYLDLGVVKNLAQVRLNGRDLGVVWCAPWRAEIRGAVKARDNQLEITVANLWPNRLIGDVSLPPEKRVTWTTWNPFKKDSPLLESGLIGPVTLRSAKRITVREP
ncbi:MAG: glycosyl hydrolase [Limisphaerales bacterium]